MPDATLTAADLLQFTGTEQWHRHGIVRDVLYTDGAKYVADLAGAYWLLDEIALAQRGSNRVAAEAFQHWKITVKPDHAATLTCDDGNGQLSTARRSRTPIFRCRRSRCISPTG